MGGVDILGFRLVVAAALLYVIAYAAFWPQTFTSLDESTYFNMAFALRNGTVYPDVAGLAPVGTYQVGSHLVSKYPLGMSALLAVTSLFGWSFALGTNLVIHLATFGTLAWLLHRHSVPPGFALLFLFHPTAVLYSRTVMADPPSGLILLLAFGALLQGRHLTSGGLLGLAVLFRTPNAVALPAFALACLLESLNGDSSPRARMVGTLRLVLGAVPLIALALYYAQVIAGGQMLQHTGAGPARGFSLGHFPVMFPAYLASLMIIFPGMLLAPLVRVRGRAVILASTSTFLLLYSLWYWRDRGTSAVETLVVGQRYFLIVLPLLVFAYAVVVWRLVHTWPTRTRRLLAVPVCILLLAGAIGVHARHASYLEPLLAVRHAVLQVTRPSDLLVTGTLIAKLLHPAWGTRPTCVTGGSPEDVPRLRQCVEWAVARRHQLVFVANWFRSHRDDDRRDAAVLEAVTAMFATRPVRLDGTSLPAGFHVIQVVP